MPISKKFVLDRKKFYFLLNGVWTDLTSYVLVDPAVEFEWGLPGDNPITDLVATTGTVRFSMENSAGLFTPNGAHTLAGWAKGIRARVDLTFLGDQYRRFYGFIGDMAVKTAQRGPRVAVTLVDWMDYSARFPLSGTTPMGFNQRADQLLVDIINKMTIQPTAQSFDTGINVFPLTYSTMTKTTKAITEMQKIASSEFCHVYLRRDKANGETLKLENLLSRHGWNPLSTISAEPAGYILMAGSPTDYILQAGSTTDKLFLQTTQENLSLYNTMLEGQLDIRNGSNVINIVDFTAYPSRTDVSNVVLFTLQEPQVIAPGQKLVINGNYFNAGTGVQCNAKTVVTPVANTDYKAWTNSNGSGTDFTANVITTFSYTTDGFSCTLKNISSYLGYITTFQVRGIGVYIENTITAEFENTDSSTLYGEISANLDQKYQRNLYLGQVIANSVVEQHKDAVLDLKSITFNSNSSSFALRVMLGIDIGFIVEIISDVSEVNGWYYVDRIKIMISPGDVYTTTLFLSPQLSLASGNLIEIAAEFRGEAFKDGITFGHLPYIADLPNRTMSVWIKPLTDTPNSFADMIMGFFSDNSAFSIYWLTNGAFAFIQKYSPNGQQIWWSPAGGVPVNFWTQVTVSKDLNSNNPPLMYVNGSPVTATLQGSAVSGLTAYTDLGVPFILGNISTSTIDYGWGFKGLIQDARVYDYALTAANVLALYNGGVQNPDTFVNSNLKFQALSIRRTLLSQYIDQPLADKTVFDNILRAVGNINDSPIGRSGI